MQIPILTDILIIFGLSVGVLFLCHRFRIPSIVGFLLTGILAGPYGLGLINGIHNVELLAEIGVVLLLFSIGIEFSLKDLLEIRETVLLGGSLQVLLTIALSASIVRLLDITINKAIFLGFLIALSSTAIVLKVLQERGETDSPHGRTDLGILIFQDIIIVPMMLLTPLLAGAREGGGDSFLLFLAKGSGILVLVFVLARWVVPQVFFQVARTRSRELFLLVVVVLCLAVAWLTASAGLSLALGAFLAGLLISESEYSWQALSNILPFRDVFSSFFFISIGMLLNVRFLVESPVMIVLIGSGVIILKGLVAGAVAVTLGYPLRTALLVGCSLSQIGEFSFILSRAGVDYALLPDSLYQLFLSASILTMAATPFIMRVAPKLTEAVLRLPWPGRLASGVSTGEVHAQLRLAGHLIIIGFGVTGRNLAKAATAVDIPHVIVEMNAETVRQSRKAGVPIFFGDATQEAVLEHAQIHEARTAVVAINDPAATRRITEAVRRLSPTIHLIVRTRYLQEMKPLYELGANEVIPEEFETAVEIFARLLTRYLVPREEIARLISDLRADGYDTFRSLSADPASVCDLRMHIPDISIVALRVEAGSPLVGKTLAESELRKKHHITVLAIRHNSTVLPNPDAETCLNSNDVLIVLSSARDLDTFAPMLRPSVQDQEVPTPRAL
jgi:CPA2 family monovalent cation:H+ antiporter-2